MLGNFDSYPSKHVKESNKQKKKVNFRVNRSSLPSTTIIQTNQENQELQHVAQDLLNTYCHRSCTSNFKSNKNSRAFKTNITSYSMTFDDPVEEHEFKEEDLEEREEQENEEEEEDEELLENMTVESQRDIQDQPYVNNDDDRDIAIRQRRPLNEHQQIHNRTKRDKYQ
ncbi:unnamed protein product [Rotaria magnacalcarata]|uniref:Uncharacterized protein n=1 Tax=Rotaria magnacalcarata TaxID=392030 RepID=A0A816S028_9BILA|nr:unnamed protein product [Rotaria magnacalcarata]